MAHGKSGQDVSGLSRVMLPGVLAVTVLAAGRLVAEEADYLSDRTAGLVVHHQQQWGDFGWDRAAARTGGIGSTLRVGDQEYQRGLGHHARGEIVVELRGRYDRFQAGVGVQWQGGQRGSVVFRVLVDGDVRFETGPMTDSDALRPVDVAVAGAQELRLIATDAGDGIGCDMADWVEARLIPDAQAPFFGTSTLSLGGQAPPPISAAAAGFALVADASGPQVAVMESAREWTVCVHNGEHVEWSVPVKHCPQVVRFLVDVQVVGRGSAEVALATDDDRPRQTVNGGARVTLATGPVMPSTPAAIHLATLGTGDETGVRWSRLRYVTGGREVPIPLVLAPPSQALPPPVLPELRAPLAQELIRWDWKMQDGIATAREPRTWREATASVQDSGQRLLEQLVASGVELGALAVQWQAVRDEFASCAARETVAESQWETLWCRTHELRRQIALANPLARCGPLAFVKCVPSSFSHQLTQYDGRRARPGGGVFVLDDPGHSLHARRLDSLLPGSYLHLDVSWDGSRVVFAHCATDPGGQEACADPYYHLYEVGADGTGLRQLTEDPVDDFAPRYLPNGQLMFVSTRRGGFHRCGRGPCQVFTLAVAESDGSGPRVVSFHETHEWDPAVLNDGRVIYTRWDYVDRHAVHYQQLWTVRPDGSDVRAFYGNNTLNPVGVWEARAVPGSHRVMATAAAHHAMTAGSIILLDIARGLDGLTPIDRLTPDALFPESEAPVQQWHATAGVPIPPEPPAAQRRWPGHCYRTPFPLSEDFFLAAYSFAPLVGEPQANAPNMFGIYLVDRFGNKELLYRDVAIGSLWPMPLRARPRPPVIASLLAEDQPREGTFWMQDVYDSWPQLARAEAVVKQLRIVQVLPKTTPHANTPRVGLANASPGKQVLGTIPVEADGSAYFRAPAGVPLAFQALDERGMAIQTMRSLTYLQPGEHVGCVGCHEHRTSTPAARPLTLASQREPSRITPGPDGSHPFNYAILVQPILDQHCVSCHGGDKLDGNVDLTSTPEGQFTRSYNALAPRVAFSEWKGTPQANHEPLTYPDQFGARASRLMRLLLDGHEGVQLDAVEIERLITWMDANALFYGTFTPADQARQQRGERIAGPALE